MWKVHLTLITVNLIYGANYTIAKEVMPAYIKPYGFVLLRVLCSTTLFYILQAFFVKEKVSRKDFPRMFFCGFFGIALNQLLFLKGLDLTSPINASLMMITAPISVLLIAVVLRVERLSLAKMSGVLLAALGAFIVIYYGKHHSDSQGSFLGDIYVLINAASYAMFLVLAKPLMGKYHPITIITWVFAFGLILVIPAGWSEFAEVQWQMPFSAMLCIAYVVVGATFFAYLLNISALNKADPSLVGIYIYSQPVIASVIALAFGKDELNWAKVLATVLIFSGVYFVSGKRNVQPRNAEISH